MARRASVEVRQRWRRLLVRFVSSDLSVAEFCRREQVSVASFYQWRKKLQAKDGDPVPTAPTPPTFLPVQVAATTSLLHVAFPNGATLTLPVDDHQLIKLSIEAVAMARTTPGEA